MTNFFFFCWQISIIAWIYCVQRENRRRWAKFYGSIDKLLSELEKR